jgi:hypothetical protein
MARRLCLAAVASLVAVAACSPVEPTLPTVATSVSASGQGRNMTFTVSPWPLDSSTAFLCLNEPGPEFTIERPIPGEAAGCVPLESSIAGETLTLRLPADSLDPDVVGELARSGPPWYLAMSGTRGFFSTAVVVPVVDSPVPGPPGPS